MTPHSLKETVYFADFMIDSFNDALEIARRQIDAASDRSVAKIWNIISEHIELRLARRERLPEELTPFFQFSI